jgi:hypothetical protein
MSFPDQVKSMLELQPSETVLTGSWIVEDERVVSDDVGKRVKWLVGSRLKHLAGSGWEILYQDPSDGRLWLLTYPNGDWQGGGPAQLIAISHEDATSKFGVPL